MFVLTAERGVVSVGLETDHGTGWDRLPGPGAARVPPGDDGCDGEVEGTVAPLWSVDEWFDDWLKRAAAEPFLYDSHIRPMADLVPADAAVFRMEDGLDPIVGHLDWLAGNKDGERTIAPENVRRKAMPADAARLTPSPETLARIADYYAEDFRRFGYSIDQIPKSAHAAPKPTSLKALVGSLIGRRG